jgi:ribonuclease P protein component
MRLRKSWQFRKVYDDGAKVVCDSAVIFFCKNPGEASDLRNGPCFGVVASKRVGNAVKRNRAKRLLRVAIREFSGKLNHRDIWVVLVAKSNIIGRSSLEVQNDVGQALEKARLITGSKNN